MNKASLLISTGLLSSALFMGCTDTDTTKEVSTIMVKDGTYSNKQEYSPQDGYNFYINVDLIVQDQKISAIDVTGDTKSKSVVKYITAFENGGIRKEIIGKSIEDAKDMGYVSGASSTSQAFKKALEEIEEQASSQ